MTMTTICGKKGNSVSATIFSSFQCTEIPLVFVGSIAIDRICTLLTERSSLVFLLLSFGVLVGRDQYLVLLYTLAKLE